MDMLTRAAGIFRDKCLLGVTANRDRCVELVRCSAGIVTILVPYLGYDEASTIAKEAQCTGRSVYDLVLERGLMTAEQLNDILDPGKMTCPRMVRDEGECGLE
jgi:aspartate ammonia-lyase